jgi:hypothetical protein
MTVRIRASAKLRHAARTDRSIVTDTYQRKPVSAFYRDPLGG